METGNSFPLRGRKIVVTRAAEQATELVERFERLGAEVVLLPTVALRDPEDWAPLDRELERLTEFDWLIFTSQNAVRYFSRRCRELGLSSSSAQSSGPRVAAVGPATSEAAAREGLRVDYVAKRHSGESLAEELKAAVAGCRVLLPRSDSARGDLPAALRAAGADVVEVIAYRTVEPDELKSEALKRIMHGEADVVTFASPSAFQNFADETGIEELGRMTSHCVIAALGPVTAQAIRETGVPVGIEAKESTSAGLVEAIEKYFTSNAPLGVKR